MLLTQQSQESLFFGRMNITEKGSRELNMTGWNFRNGACSLKLRRDEVTCTYSQNCSKILLRLFDTELCTLQAYFQLLADSFPHLPLFSFRSL